MAAHGELPGTGLLLWGTQALTVHPTPIGVCVGGAAAPSIGRARRAQNVDVRVAVCRVDVPSERPLLACGRTEP